MAGGKSACTTLSLASFRALLTRLPVPDAGQGLCMTCAHCDLVFWFGLKETSIIQGMPLGHSRDRKRFRGEHIPGTTMTPVPHQPTLRTVAQLELFSFSSRSLFSHDG